MSVIKDHHCFKCGVELTSPSPVAEWVHGTAVTKGMTVDLLGGVGSAFESIRLVGVICDDCINALAPPGGKLTAYYGSSKTMPGVANLIDGTPPLPTPPAP